MFWEAILRNRALQKTISKTLHSLLHGGAGPSASCSLPAPAALLFLHDVCLHSPHKHSLVGFKITPHHIPNQTHWLGQCPEQCTLPPNHHRGYVVDDKVTYASLRDKALMDLNASQAPYLF